MSADFPKTAHWRDSARQVRFFLIDYRASFALLAFIFFPSWTLLYLVCAFFAFLFLIERYGYTMTVFFRVMLVFLGGRYRSSTPWWRLPFVN